MKIVIDTTTNGRYVDAGPKEKIQELSEQTIKNISKSANAISDNFWNSFQPQKIPNNVEIEFGISIDANADIVVVKSAVEANFKITMKWDSINL